MAIRTKLQNEIRRAQEVNRVLRDQIEVHQSQLMAPSEHQVLIAQFFTQSTYNIHKYEHTDIIIKLLEIMYK